MGGREHSTSEKGCWYSLCSVRGIYTTNTELGGGGWGGGGGGRGGGKLL